MSRHFLFRGRPAGPHVLVNIFAGETDAMQNLGAIRMSPDEWESFRDPGMRLIQVETLPSAEDQRETR